MTTRSGKAPKSNGGRPALIPQPGGRGALLAGGVLGNAGGPGRPSNEARKRLGAIIDARYHIVEQIADGVVPYALTKTCEHCGRAPTGKGATKAEALEKAPSPADRLRALDMCLRFSLGEKVDAVSDEWVRDQLASLRRIVREFLPPDLAAQLLARVAAETFQ